MFRKTVLALSVGLVVAAVPAPAQADTPRVPWTGANPYVFALGDSIVQQCGEQFGMGWRSLGFIGWPGSDTSTMRGRLDGTGAKTWDDWTVTESSLEEERTWFRDAGSLVIGLGTNDVKVMEAAQFRANIDWYLEQSRGRPVQWFNITNPPFQAKVDQFNAELLAAEKRWPNLKVMDWARWVRENPGQLHDGVHVSFPSGCTEGRDRLVRHAAPDEPGKTAPDGYWYPAPGGTGSFALNGWGAPNVPDKRGPLQVNVRADYKHVGRWSVSGGTNDPWALAASGRAFGVGMGPEWRGRLFCLDLVDSAGQFTALGCRTH